MPRVITGINGARVGAFIFRDRDHPYIGVQKGIEVTPYGYFKNVEAAKEFMHELALAVGAEEDNEEGAVKQNGNRND